MELEKKKKKTNRKSDENQLRSEFFADMANLKLIIYLHKMHLH